MKYIIIFSLLSLYVSCTHGESSDPPCKGFPGDGQICEGLKNRGVTGWPICRKNANSDMWYFDTKLRTCKKLSYKGCGGSKNRFCTRSSCAKLCKRSTISL